MLHILLAELRQYRQLILISYGVVAIVFALPFLHESFHFRLLNAFLIVFVVLLEAARRISNSERLLARLPITRSEHALARMMLFTLCGTGIVLVSWLSKLVVQGINILQNNTSSLFTMFGFFLYLIALFLINIDINSNPKKVFFHSLHVLTWIVFWVSLDFIFDNFLMILVVRFLRSGDFSQMANPIHASPLIASVFILAGLLALCAEHVIYAHRASYLDRRF